MDKYINMFMVFIMIKPVIEIYLACVFGCIIGIIAICLCMASKGGD